MKGSLVIRSATVLALLGSGPVIAGEPGLPWTTTYAGPHGAPASTHWTATIGTGHASRRASPQSKFLSFPQVQRSTAEPQWTATIGAGDAAASNDGDRAITASGYRHATTQP